MTSVRVSLTILCALTLSLAFALPVNAQIFSPCTSMCSLTSTATGRDALKSDITPGTGLFNTATGAGTLQSNTFGAGNTATGTNALARNTTGLNNTALGISTLLSNTTGSDNIAVGAGAGNNLTTGNNNIHIGNDGNASDTALIRIGTVGDQTRAFIAGIFGANVLGGALPVEVDRNGQLGTVLSSRRVKDDISNMQGATEGLGKLRPVTFRYKAESASGPHPLEYGLIAEEVAEIYPELVVRDTDGQPAGVRYHVLPAMLLNELQRQQRDSEARFVSQQREIDELRAQVRALIDGGKATARQ